MSLFHLGQWPFLNGLDGCRTLKDIVETDELVCLSALFCDCKLHHMPCHTFAYLERLDFHLPTE